MTTANAAPGHAELMDDVYRHQRYIYDLTRKYYLFGRDALIDDLDLAPGERLIEIGCGTARNLIRIAGRHPGAVLFGLDASQEMLKTAAAAVARAGLSDRIKLVHGYAENISPALFGETAPFDRALFSYSLSMIPDWKRALVAADAALAPHGKIHVVDFGDLKAMPALARRLLLAWLHLFHVEPRAEILASIAAPPGQKTFGSNALRLLAGRYAFVWTCSKDTLPQGMP